MRNKTALIIELIKSRIILVLFVSCVTLPILFSKTNFWDGAIASFAVDSRNLSGITIFTSEAGYIHLKFIAELALIFSKLTALDYFTIHKIVAVIQFILLLRELQLLAKSSFGFNQTQVKITSILFCFFPFWFMLQSSVMDYFIFALIMCMFGIRKFTQKGKLNQLIGLLSLLICFQVGSMLVFAPALYIVRITPLNLITLKSHLSNLRLQLLLIIVFLYWLVTKIMIPPNGLYLDYNKIKIPTTVNDYQEVVRLIINAHSYLVGLTFFITALLIINLLLTKDSNDNILTPNNQMREVAWKNVVLLTSSIIPYFLTGKIENIDQGNWNARFALLLTISLPIAYISAFSHLSKKINWKKKNKTILFLFCLLPTLIIYAPPIIKGNLTFYNQQIFTKELFLTIKTEYSDIPSGIVEFRNSVPIRFFNLSIYDTNYQLWRNYEKGYYWSELLDLNAPNIKVPKWTKKDVKYFNFYASSGLLENNCRTTINFDTQGFSTWRDLIINIFDDDNYKVYNLKMESNC